MYYVNVYKKHQSQSRARFYILPNYQTRRANNRLLHEPTASDRFHASPYFRQSADQKADQDRRSSDKNSKYQKIGTIKKVCF